ncbi:MAG: pyridoxamine 5'-phosphate oxidase family protein [Pseudomonadota bacterium]
MPEHERDDLAAVAQSCLDALTRAAHDKKSPLRWPVLISAGVNEGAEGRVVVLRGFDRTRRRVEIWTDRRSGKVMELRSDPFVSLLFFERAKMIQMRAKGRAEIVTDGEGWEKAFERANHASLDDYTTTSAPGDALNEADISRQISLAQETFTQILIEIDRIDWLHLSRDGHRRAFLDWRPDSDHSWRIP